MNKKAFQTTKLNEIRQKQRQCFLIFPIIMAALLLWGGTASVSELNKNNLVPGLICLILMAAFCSVILGIVPFYMRYVKLQGQKKQLLESDWYLIEHLVIGDWKQEPALHSWEQMTVSEAKKAGWLADRFLRPKEVEQTDKRPGRIALRSPKQSLL